MYGRDGWVKEKRILLHQHKNKKFTPNGGISWIYNVREGLYIIYPFELFILR